MSSLVIKVLINIFIRRRFFVVLTLIIFLNYVLIQSSLPSLSDAIALKLIAMLICFLKKTIMKIFQVCLLTQFRNSLFQSSGC